MCQRALPLRDSRNKVQGSALLMAFATLIALAPGYRPLRAQDIAGTWQGAMQAGKEQRILVKIAKTDAGWTAVVYSLDSGMAYEGRAATQISLQGANLRFAIAPIESSYQGKLSEDGATIAGTWTQSGASYALNLARVTGDAAWEIPRADAMMAKDADPDLDVVSVRPRDQNDISSNSRIGMNGRRFELVNKTVLMMLEFGYGVDKKQIAGAPNWIETERWDVQGVPNVSGHPSLKQLQSLTQKVLAERFGLRLHRETKEMAVYAVTVAKGGAKIARSVGDPNGTSDESDRRSGGQVTMRMTNASMGEFTMHLGFFLDRPAVDRTGLAGRYDFQLNWTADESHAPTDGSAAPGLFTAIQEQIGLKLEPVKAPADVLVVDAVEKPEAN